MTQFDLRFQDLLRHSDWRVEPCHVWIGSSGEWASGESHQRVIHRADPALYVIPRLFRSIVSPKMRSFATWAERRELVRFARQVVRLDGLSAAWKVTEPEKPIEPKPKSPCNVASAIKASPFNGSTSHGLCVEYLPWSDKFLMHIERDKYLFGRLEIEQYRVRS